MGQRIFPNHIMFILTQNKGKESEKNLPKIEEITVDRHTNTHMETKSKYFEGHDRLSQSEESKCM
jgi:hypothetical protein